MGVNTKGVFKFFYCLLGLTIFDEYPHQQPMTISAGVKHKITFRDISLVIRANQQIFTALAFVRAGRPISDT
jgi:hypothetical protein